MHSSWTQSSPQLSLQCVKLNLPFTLLLPISSFFSSSFSVFSKTWKQQKEKKRNRKWKYLISFIISFFLLLLFADSPGNFRLSFSPLFWRHQEFHYCCQNCKIKKKAKNEYYFYLNQQTKSFRPKGWPIFALIVQKRTKKSFFFFSLRYSAIFDSNIISFCYYFFLFLDITKQNRQTLEKN